MWEWKAADEWIPYDQASCVEIEDGYQSFLLSQRTTAVTRCCVDEKTAAPLDSTIDEHSIAATHRRRRSKSGSRTKKTGRRTQKKSKKSVLRHRASVALTKGFFATRNGYTVKFSRSNSSDKQHHGIQLNAATGMQRLVRRIAPDDDAIFVPVPLEEITQASDICSICQEGFLEKSDAVNNQSHDTCPSEPCKLQCACTQQFFHRQCIAPYVTMSDLYFAS
jgi:WWE domain